jgi:hypothetical protein
MPLVAAIALIAAPVLLPETATVNAQSAGREMMPVKERHLGASRAGATRFPRGEGDQAIVDGWPLYRTERGQTAFNDAMATLKATDGAAPPASAFKGCVNLECALALPQIGADGWIPAGRIWVSPESYVLFVHSPRARPGQSYRRRAARDMRVFVFHEFHNSSRNTDPYDTISSHSGSVFVPFYMSKQASDVRGRSFVIITQVAPYDVYSIHATNHGSAGPGIEIAKNMTDALDPMQAAAGILVANIAKAAAPQMRVVNHAGAEGLSTLQAYERQTAIARTRTAAPLALPFVPAAASRVAVVAARLDDLILRRGASPRATIAERSFLPPRSASQGVPPGLAADGEPRLIGPIQLAVRPQRAAASGATEQPVLVVPVQPAAAPPRSTLR